jgi:hypothetical protein
VALDEFAKERGGVLAEFAVVRAKGSLKVRVNIEFARNFAVDEDGNDNFGLGFERTGEIAGIGIDVVHDDRLSRGSCCATNPLVEGNPRVRGHGALERTKHENVSSIFFF